MTMTATTKKGQQHWKLFHNRSSKNVSNSSSSSIVGLLNKLWVYRYMACTKIIPGTSQPHLLSSNCNFAVLNWNRIWHFTYFKNCPCSRASSVVFEVTAESPVTRFTTGSSSPSLANDQRLQHMKTHQYTCCHRDAHIHTHTLSVRWKPDLYAL